LKFSGIYLVEDLHEDEGIEHESEQQALLGSETVGFAIAWVYIMGQPSSVSAAGAGFTLLILA